MGVRWYVVRLANVRGLICKVGVSAHNTSFSTSFQPGEKQVSTLARNHVSFNKGLTENFLWPTASASLLVD